MRRDRSALCLSAVVMLPEWCDAGESRGASIDITGVPGPDPVNGWGRFEGVAKLADEGFAKFVDGCCSEVGEVRFWRRESSWLLLAFG